MSAIELVVEIVGWLGAALILGGYALLTAGRVQAQSIAYQAMNVVGAAGFIVNGWWHGAVPSAVLNVVWMMIGAVALTRIVRARPTATPGG